MRQFLSWIIFYFSHEHEWSYWGAEIRPDRVHTQWLVGLKNPRCKHCGAMLYVVRRSQK